MSLKRFFIIMLVIVLSVFTGGIVTAYISKTTTEDLVESIRKHDFPTTIHLHLLLAHGLQAEQATRNVLLNPGDERAVKNYIEADKDFRESLSILEVLDKSLRDKLSSVKAKWQQSHVLRVQAQDLSRKGQLQEAIAFINKEETPLWRDVKSTILTLIKTETAAIEADITAKNSHMNMLQTTVFSILCFVCILVAFMIWRIWHMVFHPMNEVSNAASHISKGDYNTSIATNKYFLELRSMAETIMTMAGTLKEKLGFAQGVLDGIATPFVIIGPDGCIQSLTSTTAAAFGKEHHTGYIGKKLSELVGNIEDYPARVFEKGQAISQFFEITTSSGEIRSLIGNFSSIKNLDGEIIGVAASYLDMTDIKKKEREIAQKNEILITTADEAERTSDEVLSQTETLSKLIGNAQSGANSQTNLIKTSSGSMGEMNSTIFEVAQNASKAAGISDQTREQAQHGSSLVQKVTEEISAVQTQSLELKTSMIELRNQAAGIENIMTVISDIADQTNLLALNAAIEAARAGDAGRGFAVVADEVRKLAEKTMVATKEVEKTVAGIQNITEKNVHNVDKATSFITDASSLATTANESLLGIVKLVEEVNNQIHTIAVAAEEQSASSSEISNSFEHVTTISHETTENMCEATHAVKQLIVEAEGLKTLINKLRTTK